MSLKIKTIPVITNEQGFTATDTVCKVKAVNFDYQQMAITIHWQMYPSTWVEGMPIIEKYQVISMVDVDGRPILTQEQMGLLLSVSDEIHKLCDDIPFLNTIDGLKSFADLGAVTANV